MKIYKQEKIDGISEQVKSQLSVAYCAPASVVSKDEAESVVSSENPTVKKLLAQSNPDQIDLFYLESVLVSTGWNKNDDVFDSNQTWAARNTPEDKQFNFMHNENDIIGHITGSYILDKEGNRISGDSEEAPQSFDIITEAVLYNSWTDPENRERMGQIIAEIEEGKWFVSMECLFAGFDYALIDPEGNSKLLARDESSAFLTKHLRAYGGTGEYEGYKVGRALRQISFSGKGLVSKPANPRSVILNSSRAFQVNESDIITSISIGDVQMSDNNLLETQVAELKSELAAAKEQNDAIKAKIEEAKDKEFASTVEAFEAQVEEKDGAIAKLEETIKSTQATIAELEDTLAKKTEELNEAQQSIADMKQAERDRSRLSSLVEAGFDEAEAQDSLSLYEALDDDAFDGIVAMMYKKKKAKKKEDEEKVEKDEDAKAETSEDDETPATTEATEETEAEEVTEELFDEVESTEATLVEASSDQDELSATRASVAEWLSENVLGK